MQAAFLLQRLLKEEGAFFHPSMQVLPISSMGGGYGIVATEPLKACTLLAMIPRHSMITASKARRQLAEWEYQQQYFFSSDKLPSGRPIPEASALAKLEEELSRTLSPTNTIICYLLLTAAKHGRFATSSDSSAMNEVILTTSTNKGGEEERFDCEHAWMKTWLLSLPARYDNLLELRPEMEEGKNTSIWDENDKARSITMETYLRPYLHFERHRHKALQEQANVDANFESCCSSLSLLRAISNFTSDNPPVSATLNQFLWAHNTLMSRGFAYEPDVWALIPWVDYFNYALSSNATMSFDEGRDAYIFETLLPIDSGEQILLHYGSYTDMELLLWYGFTLRPILLPELSGINALEERAQKLRRLLWKSGEPMKGDSAHPNSHDDVWLVAVHRALGHCFSPWVDAEGSYPPTKPHESWFELLLLSYRGKRKNVKKDGGMHCFLSSAAVTAADVLAEKFVGLQAQYSPLLQLSGHDCRVGALGPSPTMLQLLKHVSRVCFTHNSKYRLSPCEILRAICWAELFCNHQDIMMRDSFLENGTVSTPSDSVKVMAQQASLDAASLLYLLAVQATEEELCVYLSSECN